MVVPAGSARLLVEALRQLEQFARERGGRFSGPLVALRDELVAAATDAATDADARTQERLDDWLAPSGHDLLDSNEVARILGCSPSNARDLARRGTLPAVRTGGRWLFEADVVRVRVHRREPA
ncbi:helix-turn-helix domain-containing protein [Antrihabitans spumae]|uniref:Helix-turn-helix domain-containing protein n=1 Tax=Antrihabitans spumae TaxID=3373370 RepID=A0ABW7KCG8_9NOCA